MKLKLKKHKVREFKVDAICSDYSSGRGGANTVITATSSTFYPIYPGTTSGFTVHSGYSAATVTYPIASGSIVTVNQSTKQITIATNNSTTYIDCNGSTIVYI